MIVCRPIWKETAEISQFIGVLWSEPCPWAGRGGEVGTDC